MHRYTDDPVTLERMLIRVIIPSGGFVIKVIIFNSVEVVVRIPELRALEDIWTR